MGRTFGNLPQVEPSSEVISRQLRRALNGRPQAESAAALEISVSTLNRFMNGEGRPEFIHIWRAAQLTGRDLDWFTGETDADPAP